MKKTGKNNAKSSRPRRRIPVWKKLIFTGVTVVLFFGILELLLVLCNVQPILYSEDPYVGFASEVPVFVEQQGPDGKTWMVTAQNKVLAFNRQKFLKEKPEGTFRIISVGGSTTFGRPYSDQTSFSGWLRAFLSEADPSCTWDVINAGGISYASYRAALLMEQLIAYEPDLFIIYTGHNEFLEQRTYSGVIETPAAVRNIGTLLGRTRTFTLVKMFVDGLSGHASESESQPNLLSGDVKTRLDHTVGPTAFHRDDTLKTRILQHLRFNLSRMIDIAESDGARVILVTPASNLKDCAPFKSEHDPDLDGQKLAAWQELFDNATRMRDEGNLDAALEAIDAAVRIDPRHAHSQYLRGRVLWSLERYDEAMEAFTRALDEDICPLRALTPACSIVTEVAVARGAPLVDFVAIVEAQSPHRIPGENWFLDHVHPTIDGHRLLALALLDEMKRLHMVDPVPTFDEKAIDAVTRSVMSKIDEKTHGLALRNLSMVIAWAGKYEEAYKLASEAVRMVPLDTDANFQLGVCAMALEKLDEAEQAFKKAMELAPQAASPYTYLGDLYHRQGLNEQAITQYRKALALDSDEDDARLGLARALMALEQFDKAMEELAKFLAKHPDDARALKTAAELRMKTGRPTAGEGPGEAVALVGRGNLLAGQGKFRQAMDAYRRAIDMDGSLAGAKYRLARILASAADPSLRDGEEALELALQACKSSANKNPMHLDTLALAYAELGRYVEAVDTAKKALKQAGGAGKNRLAAQIQSHIALFEASKPYRMPEAPKMPGPGKKD